MSEFSKDTQIMGVPAGRIAGVVQAEGGIFAGRNYDGLLAVAQAMLDMTEHGRFGTGLDRVLRYHFPSPKEKYHPDCLRAVCDVFVKGERRNPDWQILALRSYANFGNEDGEPDEEKNAKVLSKLDYLGKDGVSEKRGRYYFGRKRIYRVSVGEYRVRANAALARDHLRSAGYPCIIRYENDLFWVLAGFCFDQVSAEKISGEMRSRGYLAAHIYSGF